MKINIYLLYESENPTSPTEINLAGGFVLVWNGLEQEKLRARTAFFIW